MIITRENIVLYVIFIANTVYRITSKSVLELGVAAGTVQ